MDNMSSKGKELAAILTEQFDGLLKGAQTDINEWVTTISQQMVTVAAMQRPDLQEELVNQLKALAGRQKIRANAAAWSTISAVVSTAMKILTSL